MLDYSPYYLYRLYDGGDTDKLLVVYDMSNILDDKIRHLEMTKIPPCSDDIQSIDIIPTEKPVVSNGYITITGFIPEYFRLSYNYDLDHSYVKNDNNSIYNPMHFNDTFESYERSIACIRKFKDSTFNSYVMFDDDFIKRNIFWGLWPTLYFKSRRYVRKEDYTIHTISFPVDGNIARVLMLKNIIEL